MLYFMIGIMSLVLAVGGAEGTADLSLIILLLTAGICFLTLGAVSYTHLTLPTSDLV